MAHAIHSRDTDVCCRWLCLSAGQRTREDEAEIAKALESMPYQGKMLPLGGFPMNPEDVWRLVR